MGSAQYQYDQNGRLTSVQYDDNSMVIYSYDALGNRLVTYETGAGCCPVQFEISSQSTNFTADTAGTYYLISGTVTVTLAASLDIGYGGVIKFKVLSGLATFAFDGAQTFNHANGTSDQNLSLSPRSGVLEMIAVESGFDET